MDTYADWLRARSDDELSAMLAARPELITPVPANLTTLASRAGVPGAASRALDRLDRLTLTVVEALLVLPSPATYDDLRAAMETPVRESVDRLRALGLVWGDDDALRVAPGIRQAIPHPAGLGPPAREAFASYPADRLAVLVTDMSSLSPGHSAMSSGQSAADLVQSVADRLGSDDALTKLLEDAGSEAVAALRRLTWGPPVGRVEDARRPVQLGTASSSIERLLARGLLVATDERTVVLPREVGLHLREGRLFADATVQPALTGRDRDPALVDRTAGSQAFTAVRTVEDLLEHWGVEPPAVLRGGGLGVRNLRATAAALDVEEKVAALLIEVAYAAGLLARGNDVDGVWLPCQAYDLWRLRDVEERWVTLVTAWLRTDRVPGLVGARDDRDRLVNALADELVRANAPRIRSAALQALAAAPAGTAPDAEAVTAYLSWYEPRRGGQLRARLVGWTLQEAEVLGLTGLGALAGHGRLLLTSVAADQGVASADQRAAKALAKVLPKPLDHVLIQADLTAVAPGPLVPELARELALTADVESTGGATVYRFTPESVRRALDAGRTASEVIDLLRRHSATEVPQPLTYLVQDVARRHGHVRVGTASAYLRCDDPATLDEILADRRSGPLLLHRIAPTVVMSRTTRADLLKTLRSLGYAPVAESAEGGVVVTRTDARRAVPNARLHAVSAQPEPDAAVVAAAVRALRAGDEAASIAAPDGAPPASPAMATIEILRRAVERGARMWIGYLDQQGQASSRIVEPARVEGGFLTAYDATRAAVQRFALHRITGVAEIDDDGVDS